MAWVEHRFECVDCGHLFDEFYKRAERSDVICPSCGGQELTLVIVAPRIQSFSLLSPEQKTESMKRRSAEHTQKQLDKEPERFGAEGISRRSKKIQG